MKVILCAVILIGAWIASSVSWQHQVSSPSASLVYQEHWLVPEIGLATDPTSRVISSSMSYITASNLTGCGHQKNASWILPDIRAPGSLPELYTSRMV